MKIPILIVLLLLANLQLNTQITKCFYIVDEPAVVNIISRHTYLNKQNVYSYPDNMKRNNPFNIRTNSTNKWVGKVPNNNEPFEKFETLEYGIRAGLKLLQNYSKKYNLNTVEGIVHKFAPHSENDTDRYIDTVCKYTGFTSKQILDLTNRDTIVRLAEAMIYVEQGVWVNPITNVFNKYFK